MHAIKDLLGHLASGPPPQIVEPHDFLKAYRYVQSLGFFHCPIAFKYGNSGVVS
jgi:hypothetical protein